MPANAHPLALAMLSRRALTAAELAERLAGKGVGPAEIAAEIERLRKAGLLDDAELARAVCRARLRAGFGRRVAGLAARRRKVPEEALREGVAAITDGEEAAALRVALERARRRFGAPGLPGVRAKVVRYLLARGFEAGQVRLALRGDGADDAPEAHE